MARIFREKGRPRRDWDRDPQIVRDFVGWTRGHKKSESVERVGHDIMLQFHDFLAKRHGSHYYSEGHPNWEDAEAWKNALINDTSVGPSTKANRWHYVKRLFVYRQESNMKNVLYERDVTQLRKFWTGDQFGTPPEGVWQAFKLEHIAPIFEAAASYAHIGGESVNGTEGYASEDVELITLMLYTGDALRNQVYGLRWDEVDLERGIALAPTKTSGGVPKPIPLPPRALDALRSLLTKSGPRRMVFRNGHYSRYDENRDRRPAKGKACEMCGSTDDTLYYYGTERDVPLCWNHFKREISNAINMNGSFVKKAHKRIEKALHAKFPDVREEVYNRRTRTWDMGPVHVHAHRWRKTYVTHGIALGISREDIAKVTGHDVRSSDEMEKGYNLPDIAATREIAGRVDLVDVSRRAAKGERVHAKSELDVVREENAALKVQVETMNARLDRMLALLEKNGGGTA